MILINKPHIRKVADGYYLCRGNGTWAKGWNAINAYKKWVKNVRAQYNRHEVLMFDVSQE